MATGEQKKKALDAIRSNIERFGHHVYIVSGGPDPRFGYTVGVSEKQGVELILPGAAFFSAGDVHRIINDIVKECGTPGISESMRFEIDGCGSFSLRAVHSSWTLQLIFGAFHYYNSKEISTLQIVPDENHWTIDVPDMSQPWNPKDAPAWRWLQETWNYPASKDSIAITDLASLRGKQVTEACRWEEDEWEMFSSNGPDIPKEDCRAVSLGTLLGFDKSLSRVVNLPIGEGLWRERQGDWHEWKKRPTTD